MNLPASPRLPAAPGPAIYQSHLERLRRDALFAACQPLQLARLLAQVQTVALAAGELLFERGDPASALFLLDAGELRLSTEGGHELALQAPRCGEEAATELKTYLSRATALTAVQGLRIPREALADLAQRESGLAARAMLGLASHLGGEVLLPEPEAPSGLSAAAAAALAAPPVRRLEVVGWLAVTLLPPVLYFATSSAGLSPEAALFAAILSATVLMWLFGLADEYVPPLLAISAVLMVGLAPPEVALAGFSSRTLTTLIGVYALASLITASGLSYRIMVWLLIRLPDTAFWQQIALLLAGYVLSPIMPSSNARLSLLLPFFRDMYSGLGLQARGSAATALMAATFSGAMLFSPMLLTSKSSNLTVYSLLPQQVQDQFQGAFWLAAAAVAALTVTLVHLLASRWSFAREEQTPLPKARLRTQLALLGPMCVPEQAALLGFVLFVAGAVTVPWHHINPAWLAAFILVALLLTGLVSKQDFQQKIDWPMIFFLLSLDGLSRCISYLGLDSALSQAIGSSFDFVHGSLWLFIPLALAVTLVLRLALPITAGMVVAAVVLMPVAAAQGIHPWVVCFLTALFSDMWFKPYQSSSYLQVVNSGYTRYFAAPAFMRYNHLMNAARVLAAYASVPYWDWLGLA